MGRHFYGTVGKSSQTNVDLKCILFFKPTSINPVGININLPLAITI